MSPGLHSKPANQKPGLWGSPPPGKAGPPESTAGDGGGEREPDFHFQGKRCTPHVHVQPEASIPDPRHPCVSRVAAPGSGGWALGLRHYPPAVRPGPSPPPRASVSPSSDRGAPPCMAFPALRSCTLWFLGSYAVPEATRRLSGRVPLQAAPTAPARWEAGHPAAGPGRGGAGGGGAALGAWAGGSREPGSDTTTQMATTWPSKQVLDARTHSCLERGLHHLQFKRRRGSGRRGGRVQRAWGGVRPGAQAFWTP